MKLFLGLLKGLVWIFLFHYVVSLFLYPLLSFAIFTFRKRNRPLFSVSPKGVPPCLPSSAKTPLLEVLIPAHNEQKDLGRTIQSIRRSLGTGELEARIVVGADQCSDQTELVAKELGVDVIRVSFASKWKTLKSLVDQSQSEWVALVDVGMEWDELMIPEFVKNYAWPELLFIAPAYELEFPSLFNKLNWGIERYLKVLENKSGGPVSVHGATVFYRRSYLVGVLEFLKGRDWLNDDVIIPLTMRALYPHQRGLYLSQVKVKEFSAKPVSTDRRFRILMGNLDILDFVNSRKMSLTPELYLLWGRRRARVFWAYFLSALFLQICLLLPMPPIGKVSFFSLGILLLLSRKAFRVSLAAPFYLLKFLWDRWRKASAPTVRWH
jgi:cellulose synthase/poly-beta-1,6-N-acetylglucosamine synthase-like glycosyltransferase